MDIARCLAGVSIISFQDRNSEQSESHRIRVRTRALHSLSKPYVVTRLAE